MRKLCYYEEASCATYVIELEEGEKIEDYTNEELAATCVASLCPAAIEGADVGLIGSGRYRVTVYFEE